MPKGNMTKDPDGYGPSDIVSRLHRSIENGIYGIDYTIIPRDKNELLIENYVIDEAYRITVLRDLTIQDYDGWELSNQALYPNDVVHLFHRNVSLIPRGIEDATPCSVSLYIKMTWTKQGGLLIIISFHD